MKSTETVTLSQSKGGTTKQRTMLRQAQHDIEDIELQWVADVHICHIQYACGVW